MKKNIFFTLGSILVGLLLIVLPKTVTKPCGHEGACVHSTTAVLVIGALAVILGLLNLFADSKRAAVINHIYGLSLAVSTILIPKYLIGGCQMESMACRKKTFPAFYLIAVIYIIISLISLLVTAARKNGGAKEEK